MIAPNEPTGAGTLASWLRRLLRYAQANEIKPGVGYRTRRTPDGTILEILPVGTTTTTTEETTTSPTIDGGIWDIAIAHDNLILIGGAFEHVNSVFRKGFAILNTDLSLHEKVGIPDGDAIDGLYPNIWSVDWTSRNTTEAPNGAFLVGGIQNYTNYVNTGQVGWLKKTGDPYINGAGFSGAVELNGAEVAVKSKWSKYHTEGVGAAMACFVAGDYTTVTDHATAIARPGIALINDLNIDTTFAPASALNNSNGGYDFSEGASHIYVAGDWIYDFGSGNETFSIIKLNVSTGAIDASFRPRTWMGAAESVNMCAAWTISGTEYILIAGVFSETISSTTYETLARLNVSDASIDTNFVARTIGGTSSYPRLKITSGGKLLFGTEYLSSYDGTTRYGMCRINQDGSLDTSFSDPQIKAGSDPGAVRAICEEADGTILVGGNFDSVGGKSRTNLARLSSSGAVLGP